MKIKYYAHACFRLEGDGKTLITDPYEPGDHLSGFEPVNEPADLVLMSSMTDRFHCDPTHVEGDPEVVNVLALARSGRREVGGMEVDAFASRERMDLKQLINGAPPRPFALYRFDLDGLSVLHTGDLGRRLPRKHRRRLAGKVDVMFTVVGGVHNMSHRAILKLIRSIRPRAVIPMHYFHPNGILKILPVDAFTRHFPAEQVREVGSSELELTAADLPAPGEPPRVYVMETSR